MSGLLFGQVWLIGIWTAIGKAPRLLRGVAALLGLVFMTSVISLLSGPELRIEQWARAMAPTCIIALPPFVASLLMMLVLNFSGVRQSERFQFHSREIFAWMAIVAVASWLLGLGDFRWIARLDASLALIVLSGGAVGIVATVYQRRTISKLIKAATGFVAAVIAVFALQTPSNPEHELVYGVIGGAIYLALTAAIHSWEANIAEDAAHGQTSLRSSSSLSKQD